MRTVWINGVLSAVVIAAGAQYATTAIVRSSVGPASAARS